MITDPIPAEFPRSAEYRVRVDGRPIDVLRVDRADFALWRDGPASVTVEIEANRPWGDVRVLPRRVGATAVAKGNTLTVTMPGRCRILLEPAGGKLLALWGEASPEAPPTGVPLRRFGPGIHDVGELAISSGQTVWVEPGAVLRGCLRITGEGVTVAGGGIVDGSPHGRGITPNTRSILAQNATGLQLRDLTVVNPSTWITTLTASDHAVVRDLRLLGDIISSDGVDLVGCRHGRVSDCFIVNGDDCFCVKAFNGRPDQIGQGARDVDDIVFERSIVGNYRGGSALEIGHELTVSTVNNVTFRDIDVMFVHDGGAAFGIHNASGAAVTNTRFEKIRVEHCYDKFVDLRVIRSRFSHEDRRGHIRGVVLEDCDWWTTPFNAGYTTSQIGGFDAEHLAADIAFRSFRVDGRAITSVDEIDLFTRHARDIRIEA